MSANHQEFLIVDVAPPAFVIDHDAVLWPVIVENIPVNGGEFASFGFEAQILVMSEADYAAIVAESKVTGESTLIEILADNAKLFPRLVVGWKGVKSKDGADAAFSKEALCEQLTGRFGRQLGSALWLAVNEVRFGKRLGNFVPPPAAGSASAEPAAMTSSTTT